MSNEKKLLLTVTGETFHPARIYYHVYDRKKLLSLLGTLKCMQFDNLHTRWVWLYEGEAKQLRFKNSYSSIPKAQRPIVLGSLYLRKEDEAFIDLRSSPISTKRNAATLWDKASQFLFEKLQDLATNPRRDKPTLGAPASSPASRHQRQSTASKLPVLPGNPRCGQPAKRPGLSGGPLWVST